MDEKGVCQSYTLFSSALQGWTWPHGLIHTGHTTVEARTSTHKTSKRGLGSSWEGQMLPYKQGDLSLDIQDSGEKLDITLYAYNSSLRKHRQGERYLWGLRLPHACAHPCWLPHTPPHTDEGVWICSYTLFYLKRCVVCIWRLMCIYCTDTNLNFHV